MIDERKMRRHRKWLEELKDGFDVQDLERFARLMRDWADMLSLAPADFRLELLDYIAMTRMLANELTQPREERNPLTRMM